MLSEQDLHGSVSHKSMQPGQGRSMMASRLQPICVHCGKKESPMEEPNWCYRYCCT